MSQVALKLPIPNSFNTTMTDSPKRPRPINDDEVIVLSSDDDDSPPKKIAKKKTPNHTAKLRLAKSSRVVPAIDDILDISSGDERIPIAGSSKNPAVVDLQRQIDCLKSVRLSLMNFLVSTFIILQERAKEKKARVERDKVLEKQYEQALLDNSRLRDEISKAKLTGKVILVSLCALASQPSLIVFTGR